MALALGKTIKELEEDLGDGELQQWEVYEKIYGLPDSWLQTGQICASFRGGKALDYIPRKSPTTITGKGIEDLINEAARRKFGDNRSD